MATRKMSFPTLLSLSLILAPAFPFSPQAGISSTNGRATHGLGSTISPPSSVDDESRIDFIVPSKKGAISMQISELAEDLGGTGRAQLCWDLYSIGIDPANYFGRPRSLGEDEFEKVYDLLPTQRRSQSLGEDALNRLSSLYPKVGKVEGGVASLSYVSKSSDGTTKLLLKLEDGLEVETVIIPWEGIRSTLCISSQVGCRQGCRFCATGRMGKLRSLSSDEILAQMFFARKMCRLEGLPDVTNIVFMGMGEPADNADAVSTAAEILTTRGAYQLSATKVTVSTVAPTPDAFRNFAQTPCVLAWSVHAVNDDLRRSLVPTTKYSMAELRQGMIDALKDRPAKLRTTMLEVALIKDVNDSMEHADELAEFAQVIIDSVPGCKLMINVIPFNDIGQVLYKTPSKETVIAFQQRLWSHDLYAFVRVTRGDDESAACGQLATKKSKKSQGDDDIVQ